MRVTITREPTDFIMTDVKDDQAIIVKCDEVVTITIKAGEIVVGCSRQGIMETADNMYRKPVSDGDEDPDSVEITWPLQNT